MSQNYLINALAAFVGGGAVFLFQHLFNEKRLDAKWEGYEKPFTKPNGGSSQFIYINNPNNHPVSIFDIKSVTTRNKELKKTEVNYKCADDGKNTTRSIIIPPFGMYTLQIMVNFNDCKFDNDEDIKEIRFSSNANGNLFFKMLIFMRLLKKPYSFKNTHLEISQTRREH